MSLDAFRKALDELAEPSWCEGTYRPTERIAIALPDGDVAAADDPTFVDWLLAHAEPAPFGSGGETKYDTAIRDAQRLGARGKATVTGFEPAAILDDIAQVLSPREHLDAKLTDVLVYGPRGHFDRHKDTPREPELVGTLVVGLPIAHEGGAFRIDDGEVAHVVDWSGTPDPSVVRWVAMFSDVDHEIAEVTAGARVTLVYALSRSGRAREDGAREARLGKLVTYGSLPLPTGGPLMIACTRQVITVDKTQPQTIEVLRGIDRDIADVLVENGYDVVVRSCVTALDGPSDDDRLTAEGVYSISRLKKRISAKAIASLDDTVTFSETADYDGEPMDCSTLAPYILDAIPIEDWVIRKSAAATLIHHAEMFEENGNFGNEAHEAYIYTLAALEVTRTRRVLA